MAGTCLEKTEAAKNIAAGAPDQWTQRWYSESIKTGNYVTITVGTLKTDDLSLELTEERDWAIVSDQEQGNQQYVGKYQENREVWRKAGQSPRDGRDC
jgi:hypothetical protein